MERIRGSYIGDGKRQSIKLPYNGFLFVSKADNPIPKRKRKRKKKD